jgi:aspartyl-tRNA(Asn)/glutamyl-tRNA(Gln) amidotransferase subunit C
LTDPDGPLDGTSRGSLARLAAMPVDIDIDHVARLARIALTDEEKTSLRRQLGVILEHAAKVGEVAADDVPPTAYAIPRANVLREDVPEPCLPVEEALRNVPDREGDKVRVPRITEISS